jgi:hypothetical protein
MRRRLNRRSALTVAVCLLAVIGASAQPAWATQESPANQSGLPSCAPHNENKWASVEGFHPFRIWYPKDASKGEKEKADYLRGQMDNKIWPKLTDLMNTTPVSKPLDICLVNDLSGALGDTPGRHGCDETEAPILMLDSLSEGESRDVLAHEFMHTLQYSLNVRCEGTWWWRESSAEWAEDYVYPKDNREHSFAHNYFSDMDQPLPDQCDCNKKREYGSYVFPFFLARSIRPELISTIWHKAEGTSLLSAMDDALPGGLKKQWPKFTLDAWNADPVDRFDKWDGLKDGVSKHNGDNSLTLGPGQVSSPEVGDIPHLAARYFSYKFAAGTRTVTFVNATPFADGSNPNAEVWAILDVNGQKRVENWTGKNGMAFCLDHTDEHLDNLTLVFSNSNPTDDMTPNPGADHPSATVAATDAGCTQWSGTVKATWGTDVVDHVTENFTLTPTFPSNFDNGFNYAGASYVTTGGSLSWSESGTDPDSQCSYSGSDTLSVPAGFSPLVMLWRLDAPVGTFNGYEWLNATISPWDPTVTENYSCPDGNGGTTTGSTEVDLTDATTPTDATNGYAGGFANGLTIDGSSQNDTQFGPTSWTWHLTSPG